MHARACKLTRAGPPVWDHLAGEACPGVNRHQITSSSSSTLSNTPPGSFGPHSNSPSNQTGLHSRSLSGRAIFPGYLAVAFPSTWSLPGFFITLFEDCHTHASPFHQKTSNADRCLSVTVGA
ncbi:hypothetical protein PoB_002369300 [Plakobranchus ocellatus]|uniref:Uncharacterized protein n=1 Tax=Plakobranchus ocellatus TaxID=259542 RepID=A0AAV3ZQS2_9GAST|nr:hypothetical protein PoB_002369300 [Plakobranchus ocellatus]